MEPKTVAIIGAGGRGNGFGDICVAVLHRNVEMGLFCPVPASFIDVSVQAVAAALVDLLQRIYRGESVPQPMRVAAEFVPEDATAGLETGEPAALAG